MSVFNLANLIYTQLFSKQYVPKMWIPLYCARPASYRYTSAKNCLGQITALVLCGPQHWRLLGTCSYKKKTSSKFGARNNLTPISHAILIVIQTKHSTWCNVSPRSHKWNFNFWTDEVILEPTPYWVLNCPKDEEIKFEARLIPHQKIPSIFFPVSIALSLKKVWRAFIFKNFKWVFFFTNSFSKACAGFVWLLFFTLNNV